MPDAPPEHRQLAAIMFTDMVDYSALAQRDQSLALELLEEHRQVARSLFPRFNGTEIKTIGDAFLVEFHSALEAAQCAIEIQRTLAKRNHDVAVDRRIEVRIGIHIGDVVHRGGDVYGDGVNIASRIQAVAGPGGICVSMDVERQIHNALKARLKKLAPTELKIFTCRWTCIGSCCHGKKALNRRKLRALLAFGHGEKVYSAGLRPLSSCSP